MSDVERASELLGVQVHQLAAAIRHAGLVPWGLHHSGAEVFRFQELVEAAKDAGLEVNELGGHRNRHGWRQYNRTDPYGQET